MRGGHGPIRQLQDLNWGAFDHASHAPQLRSCNYNVYACAHDIIMRNLILQETIQ